MPKMKPEKYWIATYSAHTDILKRLIGADGEIVKLCVDGGGLRAPKGAFSLAKKVIVPKETLHAKILLKECGKKTPLVWLWTGNMRKATFESQNILLSLRLTKGGNILKPWFSKPKRSLIFKSNGNSIIKIFSQREKMENLWGELKSSILGTVGQDLTNCKLYAFSPWGSKKFVDSVFNIGEKRFSEINLYTRFEEKTESIWIDYDPTLKSKNEQECVINRMTAEKSGVFPHMKCMINTKKDKLIWTYIGSANFTEKAMFKKTHSNIEYALLFEGLPYQTDELKKLFKYLTKIYVDSNGKGWKERKPNNSNYVSVDDEDKALKDEQDFNESLVDDGYRDFCKKIYPLLESEKIQKGMDAHYKRKGEKNWDEWLLISNSYKIKINSIDNYYHILAKENTKKKKNFIYEIDVPRNIKDKPPINSDMAKEMLKELVLVSSPQSKGKGEQNKEDSNYFSTNHINVRFLAQKYFDSNGNIKKEEVEKTYNKLKKLQDVNINDPYKTMIAIWTNLIKVLRG